MREVQINKNLILREDGKLFNVHTGEEFIPKAHCRQYIQIKVMNKKWYLHQLVMKFFGPPKPDENYEIDHFDRNPENNNIQNLRWVTRQENTNNRKCTLPVGKRLCDYDSFNEYSNAYRRERRRKKKEGV